MANDIRFTITVNGAEGAAQQVERVGAATHRASSGIKSLTGNMSVSTGAMLRFTSASLGMYFGILGVAQVLGQSFNRGVLGSIKAASALNEQLNKNRVVFGEWSADIERFAKAAPLMMSTRQAVEAASTFGAMFTSMGMGEARAADMSKALLQLAADMSSFFDIPVEDALYKLRAGLVGEIEPLRAVGVNLTAAEVSAEGFRLGLRKANEELNASGKAQAAFSLIMQRSAVAQGDAARTAGGFANSSRNLKAAIEELGAKIGKPLLPAMTDLVNGFRKWIALNADRVAGRVANFMAAIEPHARRAFEALSKWSDTLLNDPSKVQAVAQGFVDMGKAISFMVEMSGQLVANIRELAAFPPMKIAVDLVTSLTGDHTATALLAAWFGRRLIGRGLAAAGRAAGGAAMAGFAGSGAAAAGGAATAGGGAAAAGAVAAATTGAATAAAATTGAAATSFAATVVGAAGGFVSALIAGAGPIAAAIAGLIAIEKFTSPDSTAGRALRTGLGPIGLVLPSVRSDLKNKFDNLLFAVGGERLAGTGLGRTGAGQTGGGADEPQGPRAPRQGEVPGELSDEAFDADRRRVGKPDGETTMPPPPGTGAGTNPWERIADTFNKQIVEAYAKGGEAQVAVVMQQQEGMRDAVQRMAGEMARFGISGADAVALAFDVLLKKAEDWAKAMERIANDNMHDQIDAYLKGGKGAVDATKAQQQKLMDDAFKNALAFREAMGLPFDELSDIIPQMMSAMKDKAKRSADDTQQSLSGLLGFLVARRTGMGMDNGLTDTSGVRLAQPQMASQGQQSLNLGGVQITVLMPPGATTSDIGAALSAAGADMQRRQTLAEVG